MVDEFQRAPTAADHGVTGNASPTLTQTVGNEGLWTLSVVGATAADHGKAQYGTGTTAISAGRVPLPSATNTILFEGEMILSNNDATMNMGLGTTGASDITADADFVGIQRLGATATINFKGRNATAAFSRVVTASSSSGVLRFQVTFAIVKGRHYYWRVRQGTTSSPTAAVYTGYYDAGTAYVAAAATHLRASFAVKNTTANARTADLSRVMTAWTPRS